MTENQRLFDTNISVADLQKGEASLRVVHLDKVPLGSGHY